MGQFTGAPYLTNPFLRRRTRPTLKPSTSIVSKASEFVDVYKYPPSRYPSACLSFKIIKTDVGLTRYVSGPIRSIRRRNRTRPRLNAEKTFANCPTAVAAVKKYPVRFSFPGRFIFIARRRSLIRKTFNVKCEIRLINSSRGSVLSTVYFQATWPRKKHRRSSY